MPSVSIQLPSGLVSNYSRPKKGSSSAATQMVRCRRRLAGKNSEIFPAPLSLLSTRGHAPTKPKIIHAKQTEPTSNPSKIIPMPKAHIRRTESEEEMKDVSALAELHDALMFNRLVYGMERRSRERNASAVLKNKNHHQSIDLYLCDARNSKTVQSIVRSRNSDLDHDHDHDRISSKAAGSADQDSQVQEQERTLRAFHPAIAKNGIIDSQMSRGPSQSRPVLSNILQMAHAIANDELHHNELNHNEEDPDHEGIFVMEDL